MTTTNKGLIQPANGSYVDTWDQPVNNDWSYIDAAFGGVTSLNATGVSAVTLTLTQYQPMAIAISGAMSNNVTYTIPSGVGGNWIVQNTTTDATGGPWTVTFASGGGGSTVTVIRSVNSNIWSDGTNMYFSDSRPAAAAGSNTQIQYNSSGLLGGANVYYNDTSGNVGIGTTSPGATLDVNGTSVLRGTVNITSGNNLDLYNSDNTNQFTINNIGATGSTNAGLSFVSSGVSERMRIDTSGNVGIGTTSPSSFASKLVVGTSDNANGVIASAATGLVRIGGYSSGKSAGYIEALNTAQSAFSPLWFGGSILQFATSGSESMRIDSSGNLLLGTTTSSVTNGGVYHNINAISYIAIGHASGTATGNWYVNYQYAGTTIGTIAQSGTTGVAYNTTSDYRLKTNIAPMTTGLATIIALRPVTYDWISDKSAGEGFIAHEIQAVIPHAVTGEKDAVNEDGSVKPQGVDYSKIVVHLVAAIQELSAKNDALEAINTAFESRLAALESK